MGKRTADAEHSLTSAIRLNEELRALKGRRRLDAQSRIAESDKQLEFLQKQVEEAKRLDAEEIAAAHAARVKATSADIVASRQAEKLAVEIDNAVTALVGKFAQLTELITPRYDRAKQALFDSHGLPQLQHKIEVNRRWAGGATGPDLQDAVAERGELNREYTLLLVDMESALRNLTSLHFTSPAASDVIVNIQQRIRAAWSAEAPPAKTLSLASVHASATADLEQHLEVLKSKAPK